MVQCSIFLYGRNDKSELDKSALFTFDSIPLFGCLIQDFLMFSIHCELAADVTRTLDLLTKNDYLLYNILHVPSYRVYQGTLFSKADTSDITRW